MKRAIIVVLMPLVVGGGIGIALGLGLSRGVTAWMSWPTEGLHGCRDAGNRAVILTATLGAAVMPSLRASRVNPSDGLRSD
jgi:ABC-type antimicrobial peptide transport system permease subunit